MGYPFYVVVDTTKAITYNTIDIFLYWNLATASTHIEFNRLHLL